jgi:non-ribosomal peptide synthetase component F
VQVLFVMQNIPQPRRELAGLKLSAFELPLTHSKFDLAVFVVQGARDLTGYWVYSTDLFDQLTILRLASQFETLLQSAVADPETRLAALPLLSASQQQQHRAATRERKQSDLKRLLAAEPKAVDLSRIDRAKGDS